MEVSLSNWFGEFARLHRAGISNMFLLSGNVSDLNGLKQQDGSLKDFVSLRRFLAQMLQASYQLVVFFDKATGFQFGDELDGDQESAMRSLFIELVGLDKQPQQSSNPFAGLTGQKPGELPKDPVDAFPLIEQAIAAAGSGTIAAVVDYLEAIVPDVDFVSPAAVQLQRWAEADSTIQRTGQPVFLVERNGDRCAEVLRTGGVKIPRLHLLRPTQAEHLGFVKFCLKHHQGTSVAQGLELQTVANMLTGLQLVDFEDVVLTSIERGCPISSDLIWERKVELIERASQGLLEVVRPKHGFEAIGGLDYVVDALCVQVRKLREGSRTVDKGWLLMGPPGTGKTIIAEALAKESGCCFVMLRDVQSKFVGDSERNLTLCLDIIQAMAPSIVFVDEAAESIGSGQEFAGDSGVTKRLQGKLQNFIGDDALRGKVFWLFATNWPDRLPPALIREGRMDKRIPILMPDAESRESVMKALCRKHNVDITGLDLVAVASKTDRFSGAELEAVILRAKQFAEEQEVAVRQHDLEEALADFIPSRDEQAVKRMTELALAKTNSRRLLPKHLRDKQQIAKPGVKAKLAAVSTSMRRQAELN